jgi:threonine dehydrogenase-like Zn-dependent dehydrogenase
VGILDKLDERLHLAQEVGIDLALRPEDGWQGEVVRRFDGQPSVVIEAVGSPRTLEGAIEVVSAAGRGGFLGLSSECPGWGPHLVL